MGNDINRYGGYGTFLPFWPFDRRRPFIDGPSVPEWRTYHFLMPGIHVDRKEGKTIYEFELPGASKDDVDVRIEGDELVVSSKSRDGGYANRYRVTAPNLDHPDDIKARMHAGLLEVTVPDPEDSNPGMHIDVE